LSKSRKSIKNGVFNDEELCEISLSKIGIIISPLKITKINQKWCNIFTEDIIITDLYDLNYSYTNIRDTNMYIYMDNIRRMDNVKYQKHRLITYKPQLTILKACLRLSTRP